MPEQDGHPVTTVEDVARSADVHQAIEALNTLSVAVDAPNVSRILLVWLGKRAL